MIYVMVVNFLAIELWQHKNMKGREHVYLALIIFFLGVALRAILWAFGL
jgi:hypothetical protein